MFFWADQDSTRKVQANTARRNQYDEKNGHVWKPLTDDWSFTLNTEEYSVSFNDMNSSITFVFPCLQRDFLGQEWWTTERRASMPSSVDLSLPNRSWSACFDQHDQCSPMNRSERCRSRLSSEWETSCTWPTAASASTPLMFLPLIDRERRLCRARTLQCGEFRFDDFQMTKTNVLKTDKIK